MKKPLALLLACLALGLVFAAAAATTTMAAAASAAPSSPPAKAKAAPGVR